MRLLVVMIAVVANSIQTSGKLGEPLGLSSRVIGSSIRNTYTSRQIAPALLAVAL